jgi:peptidoglycan/LPS O-acetylase OafA/YrhL
MSHAGMNHRREIDGLRAVAVLPVLFFHAGLPGFSGGFIGVDVFFVISGYLITGLVLADLDAGTFSIARFYERRARRILPALFLVTFCTIPVAWVLMLPDEFRRLGESAGALALFLSNFYFLSKVDYFAPAAELQPLLHTWSLAVEEQFYLFFPPLLAWLSRRGRGVTTAVLGALFAASLLLAVWAGSENAERNFFFTGSRVWELAVGAFCAVAWHARSARPSQVLSLAGLAMIVAAIPLFDRNTQNPGLPTLLPVVGTALVLVRGQRDTLVGALLALRPLVAIGLVSYSAYLWHFPVFALTRLALESAPPPALMAGLVVVSLGLAGASWRLVEQPFRRREPAPLLAHRRDLFRVSAAVMLAWLTFGIAARETEGFAALWRSQHPQQARVLDAIETAQTDVLPSDDGQCAFRAEALNAEVAARLETCRARFGPGIAVLGDSHAIDIFGMATARGGRPGFVFGLAKPACRPAEPRAGCPYEPLAELLEERAGLFSLVIFSQSGAYLMDTGRADLPAQELLVNLAVRAQVPRLPADAALVDRVLAYLSRLGRHQPVVWLGPRVEPQIRLSRFVRHGCDSPWVPRPGTVDLFGNLDRTLAQHSARAGVAYISQIAALNLSFPRDYGNCSALYWSDEDHYSAAGERIFGARADVIGLARQVAGQTP